MATADVCFEMVRTDGDLSGDLDDHGWVTPGLHQVSIGNRCTSEQHYAKRVRMAQRGRYEWSLRDAARHFLGELDAVQVEPCMGEHGWRVVGHKYRTDDGYGEAVGYTVFFAGLSLGTAERLARVFRSRGARDEG